MVSLKVFKIAVFAVFALGLDATVFTHPGQHRVPGTSSRRLMHANAHRSLKKCANSHHAHKLQEQAIAMRAAKVQQLRQEQAAARSNLRRLDAITVLATSHKSTRVNNSTDPNPARLFDSDPKCILEPQVTEGPYYISGEFIRTDIREKQAGVDLYVDLQIVDVNTCEPVEDLYIDFWHCNSTGVYSGVVANGNGNSKDKRNINNTFARGLAPTDASGVVSFMTKFPGHYAGRAVHIHVLGTHDGTMLANKTYSGGSVAHVGQIFFDQSLVRAVKATPAYAANKQALTANKDDEIFVESAESGFDPVMEYTLLGDSVEVGVFAWISIGVDMAAVQSVSAVSALAASNIRASAFGSATGSSGSGSGSTVEHVKWTSSASSEGTSTGSEGGNSTKESSSPRLQNASVYAAAMALMIVSVFVH